MSKSDLEFDCKPTLPINKDIGIGIIGAGAIVQVAHLPAYKKAGFNVAGIYDLDANRASNTAASFGIGRVYSDLEHLLADPRVSIVDIATPPSGRKQMVEAVVKSGKHILCQKPISDVYSDAVSTRPGYACEVCCRWSWAESQLRTPLH